MRLRQGDEHMNERAAMLDFSTLEGLERANAAAQALMGYEGIADARIDFPGCIFVTVEDGALWIVGDVNGPLEADYYGSIAQFTGGESPSSTVAIAVDLRAGAGAIAAAIYTAMTGLDGGGVA